MKIKGMHLWQMEEQDGGDDKFLIVTRTDKFDEALKKARAFQKSINSQQEIKSLTWEGTIDA